MNENSIQNYDKYGLLIIGSLFGFSVGVAISSWQWFPEKVWWHNPLVVIPLTMLNYVALLLPIIVLFTFIIIRRKIFKQKN
ncbi:MAG: hypothetical protein KJ915_02090 [Candidatus Omnitrophica bacterium]|nr:hypothetical protein [Candidatus Omnitrophota bacterium]